MFLVLVVVGLVGLAAMAFPALRHGHGAWSHGHSATTGHGAAQGHLLVGHQHAAVHAGSGAHGSAPSGPALARFFPSPRAVFSFVALYGAFGNVLLQVTHLTLALSALLALFPAVLVERLLVTPLWRWLLRAQGRPSSTLDELLFTEARAVVEFHNGRGIVSTVHDSRSIQLAARLREDQALLPVKVGERVRIVEVDAEKETVTVSVLDDSEVALGPAIKTSP